MIPSVDALILSKSLALIQKTKRRLQQIDTAAFPTNSSLSARNVLQAALESLGKQTFWSVMSPEALFHSLLRIQHLVEQIESSTSEHISWPLVSYCDYFWRLLFPNNDAEIFYSVFSEHNYGIHSFTDRLRLILENILPPTEINLVISEAKIYCLQIASLENENLPLYANIGHEFGHALYWSKEKEIVATLAAECEAIYRDISAELIAQDVPSGKRRAARCVWALFSIATELFCDLVGSLIAGPAFLLSLYEMGWGTDQNCWSIRLSPKDADIRAYPSFAFRLDCVKAAESESFNRDLRHHIAKSIESKRLKFMGNHLEHVPVDHTKDKLSVRPFLESDADVTAIHSVLTKQLPRLKAALENFLRRCRSDLLSNYNINEEFASVSAEDVFQLILRLDADILPNMIPTPKNIPGRPATFATILNASALFRMSVLSGRKDDAGPEEVNRDIQKIERLTAKALEVSYVQREFINWGLTRPI